MRFAADEWLWGVFFSLLLGAILVFQGIRLNRSRAKFAQEERITELLTARTGLRRAIAGVLSCLAVALAFLAAAQPQYGKGTRILPATNLDVVLVIDYSKSMYARDVSPSRIARAKVEVGRLVRQLGGARFAAVAFAGESISFPLTSDGSAIAQFFRGMEPNHLPVGGTAIARALESGTQLLERDPLSANHKRVMILVTDGEDLEGDPVEVAQTARSKGIRVDVVQIGGQSPEPIPNIDEDGAQQGLRKDSSGKIMTTQLTAEGEAQLASIAREGGGKLVRAAAGNTGLGEMTKELRSMMSEELSERVETVFAEVYHYPLALAVLLLLIEVGIGTAPRRVVSKDPPKGTTRRRKPRRLRTTAALLALLSTGCAEFDNLFERESPEVNAAIELLKQEKADEASQALIEYLKTGPCEEGIIGAGDRARNRPDASFDLGLAFAGLARQGAGTPPATPSAPGLGPTPDAAPDANPELAAFIDCGVRVLAIVSAYPDNDVDVRARAYYLAGNMEMIRQDYEAAVAAYDQALVLAPGISEARLKKEPFESLDSDQPLGVHIAYNRALALRLQEEKEKQEQEQEGEDDNQSNQDEESENEEQDEESEGEEQENEDEQESDSEDEQDGDSEEDQDEESEEDEQDGDSDEEQDSEDGEEKEQDSSDGESEEPSEDEQQPQPAPGEEQDSPSEARDQRMLDLLEQAPTLQQHNAEQRKNQGVVGRPTMEDK